MQRSFDELGTPLHEVTFCVLDLETTGGSADNDAITEIGAIKVRGGVCLGTFHTLVNPGRLIPPEITVLTGITQAMVLPAPRIESVLPSLAEFMAGTVFVGHNVRFDASFLDASFTRAGWPKLANPKVDTCALARRLVRDEVPNCKLGTLATRFRLDHQPSHRALDDALATCDLLHLLLERAARLGVLGLDDLLVLPRLGGHPQVAKLKLTIDLPRGPGVYLFLDGRGEVLYVGKATNLRQRVRSYFSGDDRRKIGPLLREAQHIEHVACASTLDAAVTEVRLIHRHRPRYNRQGTTWASYVYVRLHAGEAWPRLSVTKRPKADGAYYLGPLSSTAGAQAVIDAIHTVVPLRRCTERIPKHGGPIRDVPCTPAQLGVSSCPCAGAANAAAYAANVDRVLRGLRSEPEILLGPLRERMHALAGAERFEEAASVRDRAGALSAAIGRQRRIDRLRRAGTVELALPGGVRARVRDGLLTSTWRDDEPEPLPFGPAVADVDADHPTDPASSLDLPLAADLADEVGCIAAWLDTEAHRVRVLTCDGELASPAVPLPRFTPGPSVSTTRRR